VSPSAVEISLLYQLEASKGPTVSLTLNTLLSCTREAGVRGQGRTCSEAGVRGKGRTCRL